MPDGGAGGGGAQDLRESRRVSGARAGQRIGLGDVRRPEAIRHRRRLFQVRRVPKSGWDYRTLDFRRCGAVSQSERVDALDTDLKPFFAHGGKLIQYHGWSDPQIPPLHSVDYYRSVVERWAAVDDSYRLFMAPGMQHCGGGAGPNQFNAVAALERWRESGVAPGEIVAAHVTNNRVDRTRPLVRTRRSQSTRASGAQRRGKFRMRRAPVGPSPQSSEEAQAATVDRSPKETPETWIRSAVNR